ncbi:DUF2771 family protein [uncultured Dietzia sp.]|uniref:DUF2771 family protein n=1 Tax=uncultured Dietzia sp. TaxID=395519 RepID=UPI0025D2664E|nr:DUF2771 family protein [uncultured Dietzia sp.]
MTSSSDSESTGLRVRPITWAILAWVIIMISAIVGAWKGSEARFGVLPQITVATDRGQQSALPFTATDLDGNSYTNPVPEFLIHGEHTLTVRLPTELKDSTLNVYEVREGGTRDFTVEANSASELLIPVETVEEGRIEGLAVRSVPVVYDADGEPTILNGEWSMSFLYADAAGASAGTAAD